MIPILHTERLILRPYQRSDFDAYAAFYKSDRTAHIGGPLSEKAAWALFAADVGHWQLHGFGWWMIEHAGAAVGVCGLHHPPHQAEREIGWSLFDGSAGRGFAYEAATAALGWGWAYDPDSGIVSYIDRDNVPSIRLAEKLGAIRDDRHPPAHDALAVTYRHPKVAA